MISVTLFDYSVDLLVTLDDYETNFTLENQYVNLAVTAACMFAALWVLQLAAYLFYSTLGGEVFGPYRHRVLFGRHTMDAVAMLIMSYMGYESLTNFGGFDAFPSLAMPNGTIAAVGAERAYAFSAAAQRLCTMQVAYEIKNFCDSVIHNDGWIFLIHHTVTCLLSALSLRPFLHLYCAYFLGWSEISTAVLCILVLFDEERGVPPLAKAAPILMKATGVAFASTFILFRIIIWPYVNYFYWKDMIHMWNADSFHSIPVACTYMFVNIGLTVLQVVWLGEIIQTAMKLFGEEGGGLSIKRGDDDETKKTK